MLPRGRLLGARSIDPRAIPRKVGASVLRESKVTVKIPRPIYRKIQLVIDSSGFSSPTDFIVFVLRDLLGEAERKSAGTAAADNAAGSAVPVAHEDFAPHDLEAVKQKLKNLGYL